MDTNFSLSLSLPTPGRNINDRPPPLCGAIQAEQSHICKPGDLVAALVENHSHGEDNWILAEVHAYNQYTFKYEVEDIDDEEKLKHQIHRKKVVPLPTMRANPETNPEAMFATGTPVLALYPQTSCFYRGVVHELPKTSSDTYKVSGGF